MQLNNIRKRIAFLLLLSIFFSITPYQIVLAKEKSPRISFEIIDKKVKKGKLKLGVKIEDKSGLKSVKYAVGKHRKPFFRYSFYAKKVKNVKISVKNKITLNLTVNEGSVITIFTENKKGFSSLKSILVKKEEKKEDIKKENENGNLPSDTSGKTDTNIAIIENKKPEQKPTENETITHPNSAQNTTQNTGNEGGANETELTGNKKKRFKISDGPSPDNFNIYNERRSVWVSFLELSKKGYTEEEFRRKAEEILNTLVVRNMNTVYFHVRPFSDAMYKSSYYPWSTYASGKEGRDPGFDPLSIMVEEAHSRGIKIHAYINPYRVNYASIFEGLKKDTSDYKWKNPAYLWRNDEDEENDRNVLKHGNLYYYNPSKAEVISLITNGVREICENYDVDGVIFDDYFYPNLGKKYKENFDAEEYDEYVFEVEESGDTPLSIVAWRRANINKMVKSVYSAVKGVGKGQEFGISPAGNINNLKSVYSYYVDIEKWCSEPGFLDYIEPQQYWGFDNKYVPFEKNIKNWKNIVKNPAIKLYFAIPISYLEAQPDNEWKQNPDILGCMLQNLRYQDIEGFSIFRYDHMTDKFLKKKGAKKGRDIFFELLK